MRTLIDQLLGWKAIRHCSPTQGDFVSPFFAVSEPDGDERCVLNLKELNRYLSTDKFKMEDCITAMALLSEGDFMIKLDLMKAYFSVAIEVS